MAYPSRPKHGLRRRLSGGLLIAALLAALLAFVPGAPATAGEVSKQGTLGDGYFFVATDGGIFNFGDSDFKGSTGDIRLNQPIVGAETTPTGEGYWLVASDGGIFTFGDAEFFGSTGDIKLNKPIVDMVATPTGKGYWLFATDGGVFTFGDAVFYGSTGDIALNKPIVGADVTATDKGYYLVASDGGIFTFGDGVFYGSQGGSPLNKPIVGMATIDDGAGYYLVASDGGIFSHGKTSGDAPFFGSTGDMKLNQPIVGMDLTASKQGYYLVAADGGIFSFGDAVFYGSTGNLTLNKPIVGMSVTPNSPITAPDFEARLSGAKETGGGDADASGSAKLDFTDDELCYNIKVNGLDVPANAAHIHRGVSGVSGPVVLTLKTPDANGTSVGCMDVDPAIAKEILANPQGFYVNIHNTDFPNGAARGQLKGHTGVGVTATTGTKAKVVVFDTENPESATVLREVELGGPAPVVGVDFRPGTLDAYLLVQSGAQELTLVKSTIAGVTTTIGTIPLASAAANFGMDFNPVVDRIRVISEAGENFRVNPDTAEKSPDTPLGAGGFAGAAYTNNVKGAAATTLFDINYGNDTLFRQGGVDGDPSPNGGALTPIGALGVNLTGMFGFDIAPGAAGTALVAGQVTGSPNSVLLAIDLATGDATNLGRLGTDATNTIQAFGIIA